LSAVVGVRRCFRCDHHARITHENARQEQDERIARAISRAGDRYMTRRSARHLQTDPAPTVPEIVRTMRRRMMLVTAIACLLAIAIIAWDLAALLASGRPVDPWAP
jgi:hypothetical protein